MAGLMIAVMIVQLLTLLALCVHHRQTARRLEWVAKDQADMKAALSSVKVIREEIQGLEEKLDELTAVPSADAAMLEGFDNLMGYSERTARGAER